MFPANDARVATVVHDVMVREDWERRADEIERKFGKVHILVNNAGVGVMSKVVDGTYKDWDWAMGVNFWGPTYGIRTFVPRMLAHKEGSHIVTTSSTDGLVLGTAGIYAVTKMAVTGLMEQMRHDLRTTNIGTSNLVPGMTTTNIARSESYRPDSLKNDAAGAAAPTPPRMPAAAANGGSPMWARPQDPLTVGRLVVNGIVNNDMWICTRAGIPAGCGSARPGHCRIHGAIHAHARKHRRRPRPLLPHADLPCRRSRIAARPGNAASREFEDACCRLVHRICQAGGALLRPAQDFLPGRAGYRDLAHHRTHLPLQ